MGAKMLLVKKAANYRCATKMAKTYTISKRLPRDEG